MKLTLVLLSVLAVSGINSQPLSNRGLQNDFEDFAKLIPVDSIQDLVFEYLAEDEDFAEVVQYLLDDEFKEQLSLIESAPEFKNVLNYLVESGIPAYDLINKLNDILGLDPISALLRMKKSRDITGGLPGFLEDIKSLLPVDQIKKLFNEKLESSDEFAKLVKRLESQDLFALVGKLLDNNFVQDLIGKAESKGVDFEAILDFIGSIFGFEFPHPVVYVSKTVREHLHDIVVLVPIEPIKDLAYEYLAEDEDFAEAAEYLLGDEFKGLVQSVEDTDEFGETLKFLEKIGVPAIEYVNKFNDFIGVDPLPGVFLAKSKDITGGLPGFLEDAKDLLPEEQIKSLFNEKVANYPEFADFVNQLKSPEFDGIVNKMLENSDIKQLIGKAKEKGIDFQAILDFISAIFGFEFPKKH